MLINDNDLETKPKSDKNLILFLAVFYKKLKPLTKNR